MNNKAVLQEKNCSLYLGDCNDVLKSIEEKSVDVIFADPPYFLSSGGISCHSGHQVSVDKGSWDKSLTPEEKLDFNRKWLKSCRRVLKDDGTIWISGTFHNIYSVGVALELEGYSIINNITWQKPNPAPNLACRCFTNSSETILWARKIFPNGKKGKHFFNYALMKEFNAGKQMKDVWLMNLPKPNEKKYGKHPTQKPESLLERIILASTMPGDLILDPFVGSGTTGVEAIKNGRRFIGVDTSRDYLNIAKERINEVINNEKSK